MYYISNNFGLVCLVDLLKLISVSDFLTETEVNEIQIMKKFFDNEVYND